MAGDYGIKLGYDKNSQRTSAEYLYNGANTVDNYTYSSDGYLQLTRINGTLKVSRELDALGRTLVQHDIGSIQGSTVTGQHTRSYYDNDSRLQSQSFVDDADNKRNYTLTYSYYDAVSGAAALVARDADTASMSATGKGELAKTVLHMNTSGVDTSQDTVTRYVYEYWDTAKQYLVTKFAGGAGNGTTQLTYDVNGALSMSYDSKAGVKNTFVTSGDGLILTRTRQIATSSRITHHNFFYVDAHRIGDVGDTPDEIERVSYAEQLALKDARSKDPNAKGRTYGATDAGGDFRSTADFDQNYEPINDNYPGHAASLYTVNRDGETLASIAQILWGDAAMWYLIADANGLSKGAVLKPGQLLVIPNKVTNIHNNSTTWRPYNPGEAIGSTAPEVMSASDRKAALKRAEWFDTHTTFPIDASWNSSVNFDGGRIKGFKGSDNGFSKQSAAMAEAWDAGLEFMASHAPAVDWHSSLLYAVDNAIGNSISSPGGVDWSRAPDESAAETVRLGRSGNAAVNMSDQAPSGETVRSEWDESGNKNSTVVQPLGAYSFLSSLNAPFADRQSFNVSENWSFLSPAWSDVAQAGAIHGDPQNLSDRGLISAVEAAASRGDPQYYTPENAVVYGHPGKTRAFGDIAASRYVLSDIPMAPSRYGPMVAAWDDIGTGFVGVPMAEGRYHFMEAPEGYSVPSRAAAQLFDLAAGTWDAAKALPGALWDTALAVADGARLLANEATGGDRQIDLWSRLAQEARAGRITFQSLYRGFIDATPIGMLGHMLDGDYRAAGHSLVGTATTLLSAPAASRVTNVLNRLPVLGAELRPIQWASQAGSWSLNQATSLARDGVAAISWATEQTAVAWGAFVRTTTSSAQTFGQGIIDYLAPRIEQYLDMAGGIKYAVPPGAPTAPPVGPVFKFPSNASDMTTILGVPPKKTGLTPDGTARIVWEPNSQTRIRFESHPDGLQPGDSGFNARHHGEHYHVEIKPLGVSWNQAKNLGQVVKAHPQGYTPGSGTGFLPGEDFPGYTP